MRRWLGRCLAACQRPYLPVVTPYGSGHGCLLYWCHDSSRDWRRDWQLCYPAWQSEASASGCWFVSPLVIQLARLLGCAHEM